MRVLRGTLTFVLGMIIGIILFVLAIGGTVAILATQISVGDLQSSITNSEVVSPDSELYDKTILDAVKGVINDVQNFDKLSLKTLYEHYGIKLLNGISGIDFTTKDFYEMPIPDLVNDLSIVVNSFTLNDVSKIAGVDFASYNLPILTNNLDNNLKSAMDNILGSLNGDLCIRDINDNFGIDLGVNDNSLIALLQDIKMSDFGSVINFLQVSSLLDADADIFIPSDPTYYISTDEYEEYNGFDFAEPWSLNKIYETTVTGVKDGDGDGKADSVDERFMLYVKKTVTENEQQVEKFVVDNDVYDIPAAERPKVYRHVLYTPASTPNDKPLYTIGYANKVDKITSDNFTALRTGIYPVTSFDADDDRLWSVLDAEITKDSVMQAVDGDTSRQTYKRVHVGTSAAILKKIAHLTISELQDADNLLSGLTISDVIEITPDTAKIIKSLAARNCKILEIGTVANELTLDEMIDITSYSYEENSVGKYVYIADGNYYTLYNPALHEGLTRYTRLEDSGDASSALLQRFAGATLDGFSNAFDELMLADVMEIDADIYAKTDSEYINAHEDERFFYFDTERNVFRVANADYIKENPAKDYYRIAQSGESASFLKKLAYVKVDVMADAMEAIVDDMMLSEFIEVYKEHAVEVGVFDGTFDENGRYLLEFGENNSYIDENGVKYVYAYDSFGDYTKSNFRTVEITNGVTASAIYYTYKTYDTLGSTPDEVFANSVAYTAKGNLYYFNSESGKYERNYVLCTYMLTHSVKNPSTGLPQLTGEYHDKLFYREALTGKTDEDVDNETVFKGTVYSYSGAALQYGIVVRDNFRGYLAHIENDPAFADKPLLTFEKSADGQPTYFVNKNDVQKLADALKGHGYKSTGKYIDRDTGVKRDKGLFYARRKCENIYVLDSEGEFVYVDGQYVPYDAQIHTQDLPRFNVTLGYIGYLSEVSYLENNVRVTEFEIKPITFIREKSSPVLRMLARGTISEMSGIINNATVGDIIDAEPGSLFDNELLKAAKLSDLGNTFGTVLTDMTIDDLISWSHVTDVDERVRLALENVTLQSLISSMVLDDVTYEIKIDMLKLYGYKAPTNNND